MRKADQPITPLALRAMRLRKLSAAARKGAKAHRRFSEARVPTANIIRVRVRTNSEADATRVWQAEARQAILPQNAYVERLIGSVLREYVDHVVVFGERHLRHLLQSYKPYYNEPRTHLSLSKDAPSRRVIQATGHILRVPILGGLHHQYGLM